MALPPTSPAANQAPAGKNLSALLFFAGLAHAISFAPDPLPFAALPYVQLISLAVCFGCALSASTHRRALLYAGWFGLGSFGAGVYWVYLSMHHFGGMPAWAAGGATLIMALVLSLFYVVAIGVLRLLSPDNRQLSWHRQLLVGAVAASVWTLTEWLRGTLFSGFPWLNIAYAHIDGVYAGLAPIFGVYAVSWSAAFTATILGLFAIQTRQNTQPLQGLGIGVAVALGIISVVVGSITWTTPYQAPMFVRLVQGNIPQDQKFNTHYALQGVERYIELAALPPKDPSHPLRLIVLPETVIPYVQRAFEPAFWQSWLDVAREQDASILLGLPLNQSQTQEDWYTNSVMLLSPLDTPQEIFHTQLPTYDKTHLVPFGEYVPKGFQWFVNAMNIPLGEFARGAPRQTNMQVADVAIAPNICYEDTFGEEIIRSVRPHPDHDTGANLLINASNLAWFDPSWASRQHLQMSRMRAKESGRPMLRATNTGVTASILPDGRVQAMLAPRTTGVLDVEVQATAGLTPYVRWGNGPILGIALGLLLICGGLLRRKQS